MNVNNNNFSDGFDDFLIGNDDISQSNQLDQTADALIAKTEAESANTPAQTTEPAADGTSDIHENDAKIQELFVSAARNGTEELTNQDLAPLTNHDAVPLNLATAEEQLQENVAASSATEQTAVVREADEQEHHVDVEVQTVAHEEQTEAHQEVQETHQEAAVADVRTVRQEVRTADVQRKVEGHVETMKAAGTSEAAATGEMRQIKSEFSRHWIVRLVGKEYHLEEFDADREGDRHAAHEGRVGSHNGKQYEMPAHLIAHLKAGGKIIDKRGGKNVEVTLGQVTLMSDEKMQQIKEDVTRYAALTLYVRQLQTTANANAKEVVNRKAEVVNVGNTGRAHEGEGAKRRKVDNLEHAKTTEGAHHRLMREHRLDQNLRMVAQGFKSFREKIQEMKHEDLKHRIDQKYLQDRQIEEQILLDSIR